MDFSRRDFGKLSLGALLMGNAVTWPSLSLAKNTTGKALYGLSAFGDLKYPADFPHFDYIVPDAPKGGLFNFGAPNWGYNQNVQTFDTLNSFILKGSAPPRMESCFDTLMVRAWDEPSSIYGLLAETVTISEDRNTYTFKLREEARFHDGSALTANDVAFTYELFKKDGHPDISTELRHLTSAKALDDHTVELAFSGEQADQLILTASLLPILSKAFYTQNEFTKSSMDVPLGSGPYRVGKVSAGQFIEFERVADYWAKDLPVNRGQYNFDTLRLEFYRERQAAFEAFKKGEITFRQEFTSKSWATEYEFPAVIDGQVKKALFPSDQRAGIQGIVCNLRKPKLSNPLTREAISQCFDFEWTNENLFYGAYARNESYFQNSEFMARGDPSPEELELLEPFRDKLPKEVFGPAVKQPVSDGSGKDRKLLRKASDLFRKAGWKRSGGKLVDSDGKPLELEILMRSPSFERILVGIVNNLKLVGVTASLRLVDPSQYQKRLEEFDFDLTTRALGYSATPTETLIERMFGSQFAKTPGALNLAGLSDPIVDELTAKIDSANDRQELIIILRALDRVLRSTHSWIPNWHATNHRVAHWDMFGFPEQKPAYWFPVEYTWWFDKEKAAAIGKG